MAAPVIYRSSRGSYALWGVGFGFFTAVAIVVTSVEVQAGRSPDNLIYYVIGLFVFAVFSGAMLFRALRPRVEFRLDVKGLSHRGAAPVPWHAIAGATVGYSDGAELVILHLKQEPVDETTLSAAARTQREAERILSLTRSLKTQMTEASPDTLARQINEWLG
ncbi:MAG: hypothetical protein R8G34_09370 [Paracoccaceae bacterium]|nr:hypothetical protein [Paracoccaceae bacterium]